MRRTALPAAIACLAALSLALPFAPVYDPWGWLVWGREILDLDLSTTAGPSWKPLPALLTTIFALAGDAAPQLWLLIARAGWIAAPLIAALLAFRLGPWMPRAERLLAAALAALGVILFDDEFTSWARQFAGGLTEPLLVALVLGAVERILARRHGQALVLGLAAALLRPEAWPLLLAYGVWAWRAEAIPRPRLLGAAALIPLLWLAPDLLGSGDPLTGVERAREATGSPPVEALEAIGRSLDLVLWVFWAGFAYAVYRARRSADRAVLLIAAASGIWIATVAVLAAAGFAGLPRFAAPAGALACVVGAIGLAELVDEVRRAHRLAGHLRGVGLGVLIRGRRYRRVVLATVAAAVLGVALVGQGALRVAAIPPELERAAEFERSVDGLDELVGELEFEGGGCAELYTSEFLTQTALAWFAERPLDAIGVRVRTPPSAAVIAVDDGAAFADQVRGDGAALGRSDGWTAYSLGC